MKQFNFNNNYIFSYSFDESAKQYPIIDITSKRPPENDKLYSKLEEWESKLINGELIDIDSIIYKVFIFDGEEYPRYQPI